MTTTLARLSVNPGAAARAWINAFLAASDSEYRRVLYRTLSVEFFENGVQFIGCSGTLLFRTWVPREPDADEEFKIPPMPEIEEAPEQAVVVMDDDKFALSFMKTLLQASSDNPTPMTIAIEDVDKLQFALGEDFADHMVTLHAFGQQLHCKVYDTEYVNWRGMDLGIARNELVDGMTISPDTMKTIGQLKGVTAIDLDFKGKAKNIALHATGPCEVRGLLAPMRRSEEKKA